VTLHAPKGLAIVGDTLFVADIDSVRAFHRTTGQPLGARGVPGASFLNDLATGPDGTLYVTDSGLGAGFAPTGTDAVYRFGPQGVARLASGESLARPNGVAASAGDLFVVPFGGNSIIRLPPGGGAPSTVVELPAGQLDGVIWVTDGVFLVSSWESSTVYIVRVGSIEPVVENVESPADIGWDARRQRVLIPVFNGNRIEIRHVP
jgi:hypothetical protein